MHHTIRTSARLILSTSIAALLGLSLTRAQAADEYWRTDGTTGGTWTSTFWNIGSANATGGTGWTNSNNAFFTANSTLTFATSTVGNVTVSDGVTVTITQNGTLSLGAVRVFDIGTGATLNWTGQTVTASSAAGITKNGAGILNLGSLTWSTSMNGGFTLNNGTVIVTGNKALGNGSLTLNGGTLQSSGSKTFTPTSIVIGGDFALAGNGDDNYDAATTIALGSSTRTITNSTTGGTRQFRGLISGSAGAGLTFTGAGTGQIYVGNTGNTFTGPVSINGGEVVFNDNGAFGSTTSITIDGGRLTMAGMVTVGSTSALTASTIASTRNIFLGATAGTALSVTGSTGVTTYNGVIADKAGSTGILVKQGGGLLSLGGQSTYTGQTSINNGTVQLTTGNDRLPTGTVVNLGQAASTNLGTLDLNGRNQTIAGLTSTAGTNATASTNIITSAGAATLTINTSGSNSYFYSAGTQANSGILSGAVSLIKTGNGSQTLGGANTYTGTTQVSGGTLFVNGSLASGSAVTVNGGALAGSGNGTTTGLVSGTVAVNSTGIVSPGAGTSTAGLLTTGAVTWSDGGAYTWNLLNATGTTAGTDFDRLASTGTLNLSGVTANGFKLNLATLSAAGTPGAALNWSSSTNQSWTILTASSITGFNAGGFLIDTTGFQNNLSNGTFNVSQSGNNLLLNFSRGAAQNQTWTASVGTNWNASALNWNNGTSSSAFVTGDNVIFGNTGMGAVVVDAGGVLPSSVSVSNTTGTYTFSGGAINGAVSLTMSGSGALVLNNTHGYIGGTTVSAGTLTLGHATDTLSNTGPVMVSGGTLILGTNSDIVGPVILSSGSITGTGGMLTGASYAVSNATGTTAISAVLGGAGALTKSNAGSLSLTGTNTYSGGTNLNGGTTTIGADANLGGSGGALGLDTTGALAITAAISSNRPLTIGTVGGTIATGGNNFSNSGTAGINGTLTATGAGTVALNGTTTFGASGALSIGTGGAVAFGQSTGTINMNNGGSFGGDLVVTTAIRINFNSGTFSGAESVKLNLSGTTISNTSSSATPVTALITSNIVLNANNAALPFTTNIGATQATGSGTQQPDVLEIAGIISGASDVAFQNAGGGGAGIVQLDAAGTYSGATLVNNATNGVIRANANNVLPTATALTFGSGSQSTGTFDLHGFNQSIASLASNTTGTVKGIANTGATLSTLTITGSATVTFKGKIGLQTDDVTFPRLIGQSDNLALVLDAGHIGTLTLTGANTYTGGTTINGGTLMLGAGGNILADTGAVTLGGGTLDISGHNEGVGAVTLHSGSIINSGDSSKALTVSYVIAESGTISANLSGTAATFTKNGAGALALTGANTYGGGTTIDGGILNVNADAALGDTAGTVALNNGATLQAAGTVTTARTFTLGMGGGVIDTNGQTVNLDSGSTLTGTSLTKTGGGMLNLGGTQTYDTLTASAGTTNVNSAVGNGGTSVTVNHSGTTLKFGSVSQTLSSLNIGAGATVTFTSGAASGAFSGGGGGGKARSFGGSAVVPEPGTIGLLLVGALGVLNRRRRQG